MQLVEFAEDAYVPAKQTEHAVDEAIEYFPAAHDAANVGWA